MVLLYSYIRKFFTRLYLSFLEAPSTSCFWPYPHFHFPERNARFYRRFDLRFRSPESSSLLCSILNPFLIINIYIYESVKLFVNKKKKLKNLNTKKCNFSKLKAHCSDGTYLFRYRQLLAPNTLISFFPSVHNFLAVYLITSKFLFWQHAHFLFPEGIAICLLSVLLDSRGEFHLMPGRKYAPKNSQF